jgi:hypothetical protein
MTDSASRYGRWQVRALSQRMLSTPPLLTCEDSRPEARRADADV